MSSNPFLLAADNSPNLLPLLRANPELASAQDEHGYSLMHAAASYNHLDLLRILATEFHVNVDLKDEDGETALFVVETLDCAKMLVEELHADIAVRGEEDKTAAQKIAEEGDFTDVAVFLRMKELEAGIAGVNGTSPSESTQANSVHAPPPVPEGLTVDLGTMNPDEDAGEVVDPTLRRRIEELASREDFQGEAGQEELRRLVTEVLRGEVGDEREVRQRTS
ncbi:ankyrin repeat protein-like protein [Coleophoma cylindrospora]|uniref:Ankyrin repeat protein-like protein n=1 Tax=Coleophoma cylindrospora TaxID=1849047 RepID=A0A3D8QWQ2_9HELO|nr:ankyrin repeat protein-like protein [Coleophoma cylindrospora]